MENQLIHSPLTVKRGRMNDNNNNNNSNSQNENEIDVISNKSSPGKIQSSQKEIDDFFENFQQQIQVRFLNFSDTVQECDIQVKKCLNHIFETEIIKDKKQNNNNNNNITAFSARPHSPSNKKNKLISLNPFQNNYDDDNNDLESTIEKQQLLDQQQIINQEVSTQPFNRFNNCLNQQPVATSDFLETLNLPSNNLNSNNNNNKINNNDQNNNTNDFSLYNGQETIKNNNQRNGIFLPYIQQNGVNNFHTNSRFRAHSINETVSDNLHRQFIQQRNNCNVGDNIFGIRDHKFERQRILSNEIRNNNNNNVNNNNINQNNQFGNKNIGLNVVKHPYLNFIQNKEQIQQNQQSNFMQNLRNAFRVTFNNNNNNNNNNNINQNQNQLKQPKQIQKVSYHHQQQQPDESQQQQQYQSSTQSQSQKQKDQELQLQQQSNDFFEDSMKSNNNNNNVQSPTTNMIRNSNVKVFKRKDNKSFRPSLHQANKINLNNQSLNQQSSNESNNLQSINNNQKQNQQNEIQQPKQQLMNMSSQQIIKQLQDIDHSKYNNNNDQILKTQQQQQEDKLESNEINIFGKFDTQTTQGSLTNIQQFRSRNNQMNGIIQFSQERSLDNNKQNNIISDKPKKKVIKISKESVFCKIIEEQKEISNRKENNIQQIPSSRIRTEQQQQQLTSKINPTQELQKQNVQQQNVQQQNQNQNFQIYQDSDLIQQYLSDNQNLQQKVKMFKFNKNIINKTEHAIIDSNNNSNDKSYTNLIHIVQQDKENINQNILHNIPQTIQSINQDLMNQEQQQLQETQKSQQTKDQQQPLLKRSFKRNISFHRKNRSSQHNDGQQQQQNKLNLQGVEQLKNIVSLKTQQNIPQQQQQQQQQQKQQYQQYGIQYNKNNQYDIEEIRSSIILKKSNSSELSSGQGYLKNSLLSKQQQQKQQQQDINMNDSYKNNNTNRTEYNNDIIHKQLTSSSTLYDGINTNSRYINTIESQSQFKNSYQNNNNNLKIIPTIIKQKLNFNSFHEGQQQELCNSKINSQQQQNEKNNNLYHIDSSFDNNNNKFQSKGFDQIIKNNKQDETNNLRIGKFFGQNITIQDRIFENIDDFKSKVVHYNKINS